MTLLDCKHSSQNGITLIELSIVLLVIGLVIGGVTAGFSLKRSAELNSLIQDAQRYMAGVNQFQTQYLAGPGDITNATGFWGIENSDSTLCENTASTTQKTCDGNGDGQLLPSTSSNEGFRFWQHLANAGFINGTYSGATDGFTSWSCTLNNSPKGAINDGIWYARWLGIITASEAWRFAIDYGNMLEYGAPVANDHPFTPLFSPVEVQMMDQKMDDGKPAMGQMVIRGWQQCTNATNNADINSDYLSSGTSNLCTPIFVHIF